MTTADGDDVVDPEAIAALPAVEQAVYATRALEDELADGGWYLIFANEDEDRAVSLYASGFYYTAKRAGKLDEMHTAESAPVEVDR